MRYCRIAGACLASLIYSGTVLVTCGHRGKGQPGCRIPMEEIGQFVPEVVDKGPQHSGRQVHLSVRSGPTRSSVSYGLDVLSHGKWIQQWEAPGVLNG